MFKEFSLGPEALHYVRSCLSAGNTLAELLLDLALEKGQVTVFLPATVTLAALQRFDVGGVATRSEMEASLVPYVKTYLQGPGKRYAVFEAIEQVDDAYLSSVTMERFFTFRHEIYYFLGPHERDSATIAGAIRAARAYPFIGALTSIPRGRPDIQVGQNMESDFIEELAARTAHILVGAYDEEGALIWSKCGAQ